jgi:hypothetical protein
MNASMAAAVVLLGIGGAMLLSGDDEPDPTTPVVTTLPGTVTLPPRPSIDWNPAPFPESSWIHAIAEAGPGLIATGCEIDVTELVNLNGDRYWEYSNHAAIWTSGNGRTWTQRLADDVGTGAGCITDLVESPAGVVAVGTSDSIDGRIWLSSDGETWDRVDPAQMDDTIVVAVEFGENGLLVAAGWIGLEARVWTSEDGREWTQVVDDDLLGRTAIADLEASERGFVMVGKDRSSEYFTKPAVWHSTNGAEWTRVPLSEFESSDPLGSVEGIAAVQAAPDRTWRVGDLAGRIWTSNDALDWELVYEPELLGTVIPEVEWLHNGDRVVARHESSIWISLDDGATWYQDDTSWIPAGMVLDGLFAFGDEFIAVGSEDLQDPGAGLSMWAWIGTWDD